MAIDEATVRDVARLAYLELPRARDKRGALVEPEAHLIADADLAKLTQDLTKILDYVADLGTLDLDAVEPTSHGVPLPARMREDEVQTDLEAETALASAPMVQDHAFAVPKVVE